MEKSNTSARLQQLMMERGLRQVDIVNLCDPLAKKYDFKMGKSAISQYVSGKVEPGQLALYILGQALHVSEGWLMGFDVPRERAELAPAGQAESFPLTDHEKIMVMAYRAQPSVVQSAIDRMLGIPFETNPNPAENAPTKTEDPAEDAVQTLLRLQEETPSSV